MNPNRDLIERGVKLDEEELKKQYPKGTRVYLKPGPMYGEISGIVDGYSYMSSAEEWGLDVRTPDEDGWGYWRGPKKISLTPQEHASTSQGRGTKAEAQDVCKCCGGINQEDGTCKDPIIPERQCKYFWLDWKKPKGERFKCVANGQKDGNCKGELMYVHPEP